MSNLEWIKQAHASLERYINQNGGANAPAPLLAAWLNLDQFLNATEQDDLLFHICLNGTTGEIEGQGYIAPIVASRHNTAWKALGDPRRWIVDDECTEKPAPDHLCQYESCGQLAAADDIYCRRHRSLGDDAAVNQEVRHPAGRVPHD